MKEDIINNYSRSTDKIKTVWPLYFNHLFQSPQFEDEDTEETQRSKVTWGRLPNRSGAEVGIALTADTQDGAFDSSLLGHSGAQRNIPTVCCNAHMTLGKRQLIFLSQEACGLELIFFAYFFFPFFVVKYWAGWKGSTQVSGVSLLVHYISESATQGEWMQSRAIWKAPHLVQGLPQPPSGLGSGKYSFSIFLIQHLFLEHLLRVGHCGT